MLITRERIKEGRRRRRNRGGRRRRRNRGGRRRRRRRRRREATRGAVMEGRWPNSFSAAARDLPAMSHCRDLAPQKGSLQASMRRGKWKGGGMSGANS